MIKTKRYPNAFNTLNVLNIRYQMIINANVAVHYLQMIKMTNETKKKEELPFNTFQKTALQK